MAGSVAPAPPDTRKSQARPRLPDRLGDLGDSVADRHDDGAARAVEIAAPLAVVEIDALAPDDLGVGPARQPPPEYLGHEDPKKEPTKLSPRRRAAGKRAKGKGAPVTVVRPPGVRSALSPPP